MRRVACALTCVLCASACRGGRPVIAVAHPPAKPPPVESTAPSVPEAVDLTTATLVEVRDTATTPHHDLVVRFARTADGFDWTAKASLYVSVLGEREEDPTYTTWRGPCVCDAGEVCACELDEHPVPRPQISRGHVGGAPVVDFLKAVAALDATAPVARRYGGASYTHRAHATFTVPGATKTTHLTMRDGAWALDEHPLAHAESLDQRWVALLAAIKAPMPAAPSLPSGLDKLPSRASIVDIHEAGGGLGGAYDYTIHLKRSGAQFEWNMDAQNGVVASALVEAFLSAVVKHGLAPLDENIQHVPWTDDNPSGSVAVRTSPSAMPVTLAYGDQRRRWRLNGLTLALDPGETKAPFHASINAAYARLLRAIDAHVL